MATYKQVEYFKSLVRELGEPLNVAKVREFSQLSVSNGSAQLTKLEERKASAESSSEASDEDAEAGQQ